VRFLQATGRKTPAPGWIKGTLRWRNERDFLPRMRGFILAQFATDLGGRDFLANN